MDHVRIRRLTEWIAGPERGCSLELWWQGPDGFWRAVWASARTWEEAEAKARASAEEGRAAVAREVAA